MNRTAYVLTMDPLSERAIFSKQILENIGFHVVLVDVIRHPNKVISNKISMQSIYKTIAIHHEYAYVFEDDLNIHEPIKLNEIIEYESISDMFFYLGMCEYTQPAKHTGIKIKTHNVYSKQGYVRGLHAIGISNRGAKKLLSFSMKQSEEYMDIILEHFSLLYPANVVRYDLQSYIPGHRGILFQDRRRFPSQITLSPM